MNSGWTDDTAPAIAMRLGCDSIGAPRCWVCSIRKRRSLCPFRSFMASAAPSAMSTASVAYGVHRNLKIRRVSRHRTLFELVQVAHRHAFIIAVILVGLAHESSSSAERTVERLDSANLSLVLSPSVLYLASSLLTSLNIRSLKSISATRSQSANGG